jgi:hypothetical protein
MGVGGQRHAPAALPLGKIWVGLRAGLKNVIIDEK